MYKDKDPRAGLFASATKPPATGLIAEAQIAVFHDIEPQAQGDGFRTWLHRGKNFVLAYSETTQGAVLERSDQPDEYVLYLPDAAGALIEAGLEQVEVTGKTIAFIAPGNSRVILPHGGTVVRLFTTRSTDLADACLNAGAYDRERAHIPAFEAWPTPADGYRIRHYSLDISPQPGRFGRLFRCTTFMVNIFETAKGPRDTTKMSPHHHDDFEQCSLALKGSFIHHLRWPWTVDMADWRDDQHLTMGSPSSLVIPPPVVHTTQSIGEEDNDLVDIFCPPRLDFSLQPGWVLNAGDYPMPPTRQES